MGRLTLNVLLSFAQFEREVIGERIRDKIVRLEQVAEAAHRGLVRHRLAAEIDADKNPHRRRIV